MEEIKEKEKKRLNDIYNRALRALETEQYDYAITLFKSALSIDPNFAKAHDGIRLARTKKLQTGPLFKRKLKATVYMAQAFFYEKFKKWEKSLEKYENLFTLVPPQPQILPHLGDVYWMNSMTDKAIATYNTALEKDANNVPILLKLGKIYLGRKQMEEARSIYDRLSTLGKDDDKIGKEVKDAYALITIDKSKWDEETSFRKKTIAEVEAGAVPAKEEEEAVVEKKPTRPEIAKIRRFLTENPDNREMRKKLAQLYLEEGEMEKAITEYRRVADLRPGDISIHETLADLYLKKDAYGEAVKEYEQVLKLKKEDLPVLKTLADLYIKQDSPLKAIEAYEKITQAEPENIEAHETLGNLYAQTRYFDKAIGEYERVADLDPKKVATYETLGNLYIREGKSELAIQKFEKMISLNPENVEVYKTLGELYTKRRDFDRAEGMYKKALELSPEDHALPIRLREIEAIHLSEMVKSYEASLKKDSKNKEIREKLEEAKRKSFDLEILNREEKLERDPQNLIVRFELGTLYRKKGEIDKALKEFQLAVNDPHTQAQCLNMIGLCFEDKEMLDLACAQFEKGVESIKGMTEDKKDILYNLGRVYEKMEEVDKAIQVYKRVYEVDINYRDVSKKIEDAYRKKKL